MASIRCGCTLSFLQNDPISHDVTPFILINIRTKAHPPARSTHQSSAQGLREKIQGFPSYKDGPVIS